MRIAIASLVLATALSAAAQEVTITSKMTKDGGAPEVSKSYVSPERFRMSQPGGRDMLFDFKSGDMTVIEPDKKEYYVMTQKDMDDMIAFMNEQMNSPEMKQAQEQMKNLPPDVQKRMQAMMGGALKTDVHPTGETRTIAGYKCEVWSVEIGEMTHTEQCMTTAVKFPQQAWDRFRKYVDQLQAMRGAMGPMASGFAKMQEEMAKMKGFPLQTTTTTTIMGHKSRSTSEVTNVSYGAIPASAGAIPAGYKQVENPMRAEMAKARHRSHH